MAPEHDDRPATAPFTLRSQVEAHWRPALERLLFFNAGQDRVRDELAAAIERYGVMEIVESRGQLTLRVERLPQSQSLFAVAPDGRPVGCVVYCRDEPQRLLALHLAVAEDFSAEGAHAHSLVLMRLIGALRGVAARTRGVESVEMLYGPRRTVPMRVR